MNRNLNLNRSSSSGSNSAAIVDVWSFAEVGVPMDTADRVGADTVADGGDKVGMDGGTHLRRKLP